MKTQMDASVVVVGAGLSGLVAARTLRNAGIEDVLVLEAREEVGGKCLRREIGGRRLDVGGMFVGPGQKHLHELADAYGVRRHPAGQSGGQLVTMRGGRVSYGEEFDDGLDQAERVEFATALEEFATICAAVCVADPAASARAAELDAISVEHWITSVTGSAAVRWALARRFRTAAASLSQISMLALAVFISSCGGPETFAQELEEVFDGGAGQLPELIAAELGDRVRSGWPVESIEWAAASCPDAAPEGALVLGPRGVVRARLVVVAMSPADARRIRFRPGLTIRREQLHRGWISASVIKTMLVYASPFWRDSDADRPSLQGAASSDDGGPHVVLDTSPPTGEVGVLAAISRLLGENERFNAAHAVLEDPERRREELLANLTRMYGAAAAEPIAMSDTHWNHEPYISGCLGFPGVGLLTQTGTALRDPIGPIHWAGAETADEWINHLSGAVQAGERAGDEVVARLRGAR